VHESAVITNSIFSLGILIIAGLAGGLVIRKINLPSISGYLLAGMLLGPSLFHVLSYDSISGFSHLITPLGLAYMAYTIGGSLPLSALKGLFKNIFLIILCEGALAFTFVLVLVLLVGPLVLPEDSNNFESLISMGLILGGISLATAPGVTLAIISDSKAKGPLTNTLLSVVALDNVLAVSACAIFVGTAALLMDTSGTVTIGSIVFTEFLSISGSMIFGAAAALPVLLLSRFARDRKEKLLMVLGMLVLAHGVSEALHLHPIITNMTLGFTVTNLQSNNQNLIEVTKDIEELIFVIFFTIAGAHLDFSVLTASGVLVIALIVGRTGGKLLGAWLGATISRAPKVVTRYLGMTLMPIAGVTVGLALLVEQIPELLPISELIINGLLAATLVNELLAPPASKFALQKAGESGVTGSEA
tara:strand:- start:867 stop:2117 length:1251 start_codon:yes stop_codon:yes gene_type:complete